MARKNKPAPKKPTIKILPRQQNATVAAIHESNEPLEFPESPAPPWASPNNDKKVGNAKLQYHENKAQKKKDMVTSGLPYVKLVHSQPVTTKYKRKRTWRLEDYLL